MSTNQQRSAAEIAENKSRALERLKQKQNKSDRFDLTPEQQRFIQQSTSSVALLTNEQKAKIEQNRQAAIERAKANGKSPPSGKSIAPSKLAVASARPNPYAQPPVPKKPLRLQNPEGYAGGPSTSSSMIQTKIDNILTITFELVSDDRFAVKTDRFDEKIINELKTIKSKVYNPSDKSWTFPLSDYEIVNKRFSFYQQSKLRLNRIPDFVIRLLRKPIPTASELELERIESNLVESLFPFQRQGVLFGIARQGRFLLGDDMGLGKTRQALAVADYYRDEWPLLIVTTAATRDMWADAIFNLLPSIDCQKVSVIRSKNEMIASAEIIIINYTSLDSWQKRLELKEIGVVIYDESHNLKNSRAKQSSTSSTIGQKAKRVILMSGTPALSRPAELHGQLALIDSKFADYFKFTQRYCDGKTTHFGWEANGATYLDELSIVLKRFMIRRTKQDIDFELSAKKREKVVLKDFKLTKEDTKDMRNFNDRYTNAGDRNQAQNEILVQWYATTAKMKGPAVCHYVKNAITAEPNEKFLIFAAHHCLMDELSSMMNSSGIKFIRIDGQTKVEIRNSLVKHFQNDSTVRCAILSIRACSAGITLTAASKVIFGELDWTPSNILQAESRAHRIGQEKDVQITFLVAPGTADDIMWKKLQTKQENLNKLGLVGQNEHLAVHETRTSRYENKATTSKTVTIDKFFKKTEETAVQLDEDSKSSDQFFTCENLDHHDGTNHEGDNTDDIDFDAIDEIENAAKTETRVREDDDETRDIDFDAIENAAKTETTRVQDDDDTGDIDFDALEEIENAERTKTVTEKPKASEAKNENVKDLLEGIDLDEDFEF